ncbi:MAG: hypothetical protein KC503_27895 [Myxococcales bacterium]|nr:hypothetical protein [Myxococcales bacterium]
MRWRLVMCWMGGVLLVSSGAEVRAAPKPKPASKPAAKPAGDDDPSTHPTNGAAPVDPDAKSSRVKLLADAFKGSMSGGVSLVDHTYTLRLNFMRTITVSPHDPKVAYVGSYDGYVFKTIDGGKTWDESRLIVEPRPFYGDGGQRLYYGIHRRAGGAGHSGLPVGDTSVPGRNRLLSMRPVDVAFSRISASAGGRVGAAENTNFGIGLPGGAPRLQNLVRKFKKPTAGLNIKQTLFLRGVRPTEVRQIIVHPKKPNVVFACTFFGLYMSYDGGLNWVRTFLGINPAGRIAVTVAVDPTNEKNVMLATGNGIYVSTDGGENYIKSTAQGVGGGFINWIEYHPRDSRYVLACTEFGLLRSNDRGRSWDWIYFTTFPAARVVRYITFDPKTPQAWIGTHDGIFTVDNVFTGSLEDWRRVGGLAFTSVEVHKIQANPSRSGHLWAMTDMTLPTVNKPGNVATGGSFIWETIDGGKHWKVIFSGLNQGAVEWFDVDRDDPDLLWIVWSRALFRMRRPRKQPPAAEQRRQMRVTTRVLEEMPRQSDVFIAAQRFMGVEPARRLKYRFRSRLKSLVPRLDATYVYYRSNDYDVLQDGRYILPFRYRSKVRFQFHEFRAMLTWNLFDLVFNLQASFFGRIQRINGELYAYVYHCIHRFYGELVRLRVTMATNPPRDLRIRMMYKLRIAELSSYVDLITGGYLTRYKKGDHPSPWKTPWFRRWPGVRQSWFAHTKR